MKKLQKAAATAFAFLVFISGSADLSGINTSCNKNQAKAAQSAEKRTETDAGAKLIYYDAAEYEVTAGSGRGEAEISYDDPEAGTLGDMLSCVIGAMLERQCFLLEGEPDKKLVSLSIIKAVSWGVFPELCRYFDESVAIISQSDMQTLCSGLFACGEISALDTETADENVYILGDKIVIFISDRKDIRVEITAFKSEKGGSATVLCSVSGSGEYICSAEAELIKRVGWPAGYSICSLAISHD